MAGEGKRDKPSKIGVAWMAGRLAGRQLLGRGSSDKAVEIGELLTGQLDQMKGLAMKIGQIVSYMGVPLSDPVQASLARLQVGQEGMDPERTREVIEQGLGASIEQLFEDFELEPIAAASIGQVHRARVDGEAVAVKVQYPDVAGSFDDDLRAVGKIASLASLASAVDGTSIVHELASRLEEECDYGREARMQRAFRRAFADDEDVVVPRVFDGRSSATVLTTGWIDGDDYETLRREAARDPERRDRVAATMIRFSYRSLLEHGLIQADPHPGNFIFLADGRVAFLDFGCVRSFEAGFIGLLRELIRSLRDRDRPGFRAAVLELGLAGKPRRFDFDHFFMVMEHLHRPLIVPSFRFTREYVDEGYAYNGPTNPNARFMAIPPAYVWVMRLQWGLSSILARLEAAGSYAGMLDEVLARPLRSIV